MKALIKKDFRNNLVPIIGSVIALALPYLIATCVWLSTSDAQRRSWSSVLPRAAILGLWATAILASTYGGIAFAHERHERFADFLAMMPTTRLNIVRSKAIVAFSCLGTMALINLVIFWLTWEGNHWDYEDLALALTGTIMMFGVAWLFSSFLDSAAISAGIGVATTIACFMIVGMISSQVPGRDPHDVFLVTVGAAAASTIGIASFIGGSINYVCRIAP